MVVQCLSVRLPTMSIESSFPFYEYDGSEPAKPTEITGLVGLAEQALEDSHQLVRSFYSYDCSAGGIIFATQTYEEDGVEHIESAIRIDGEDEDEVLLEYRYAPNDALVDEFIVDTDTASDPADRRASLEKIADVCRNIKIDTDLDREETWIIDYILRDVQILLHDGSLPDPDSRLSQAIKRTLVRHDEQAAHVSVSTYTAPVEDRGVIEVRGYLVHSTGEHEVSFPKFEIEFEEYKEGVITTFALPAQGNGEPTLYCQDTQELSEDDEPFDEDEWTEADDDLTPTKERVELLSQAIAETLVTRGLIDFDTTTESSHELSELGAALQTVNAYYQLFIGAESGSIAEQTYHEYLRDYFESFKEMFERTYHLIPEFVSSEHEDAADIIALFRTQGINTLTIRSPFIWLMSGDEKIDTDNYNPFTSLYYGLTVTDLVDKKGTTIYSGACMVGFFDAPPPLVTQLKNGALPLVRVEAPLPTEGYFGVVPLELTSISDSFERSNN